MSKLKSFSNIKKQCYKIATTPSKFKLLVKKLYNLLEEKKCYKLEHLMITAFNQCKYLRTTPMTKITNITRDVAKLLPSRENEVLLIYFLNVTDTDR